MTETTEIIFQNLFARLRSEAFGTDEQILPMSPWKWRQLEKYYGYACADLEPYDARTRYSFVNGFQEKRRQLLFDEERHAIDTSIETLNLLNLIIYNADQITHNGISLNGIVHLGNYLRTTGDKVDYVKLDAWLTRLFLRRIASLLSSALFYIYDFDLDELPFLYKKCPEVTSMVCRQITMSAEKGSLQNGVSTFRYSPLASLGIMWQKARNSLNSIEE